MDKNQNGKSTSSPLANPMASASLVLGISSALLFVLFAIASVASHFKGPSVGNPFSFPLFWLTSVPAVVLGHLALRKIGRIFDPVKGRAAARSGLALGYLMTIVLPVVASLAVPLSSMAAEESDTIKAVNNCRMIMTTLRLYSANNNGNYPDFANPKVRTSNEVFHMLFVSGDANNEQMFGCPFSPYQPDGNIGKAPNYSEAVKPGENHWAMTFGLNDSASGTWPLIYENPAEATWPPKWNADLKEVPKPGRIWRKSKVMIGMNDTSAWFQPLASDTGDRVGLKLLPGGDTDVFTQNASTAKAKEEGLRILDIAR